MAAWVRYSRGTLTYAGRITRASFGLWTTTPQGQKAIGDVASRIRFAVLGRNRAARRRLWRQLSDAARAPEVAAAVQREAQGYLERLGALAYADGLPRIGVELHRLVVVPRVLVNAAACRSIEQRLKAVPAFAALEGGQATREFFIVRLVEEMMSAVSGAQPSPRRPIPAGREWSSVGQNSSFVWRMPLVREPAWPGHHYVLEETRNPVTRAVRKLVGAGIERFEATLPALSRIERDEILRRAAGYR
jgi:hypothetical protein